MFLLIALTSIFAELDNFGQGWKIKFDDDQTYMDYDYNDSSWLPVELNAYETDKDNSKGSNYVWIRKQFSLTGDEYRFSLGKIEASMEIYFIGTMVYKTGTIGEGYFTNGGLYNVTLLPSKLFVENNKNVLAVRFYNDSGKFKIFKTQLYEGKEQYYIKPIVDFLNSHLYLGFGLVALVLAFFYILQYLLLNRKNTDLYFSLANIALFIYFVEMGLPFPTIPYVTFQMISKSMLPLFLSLLTVFIPK